MKKLLILTLLVALAALPLVSAEICQAIDDKDQMFYVDCQTGERVLTADEQIQQLEQRRQLLLEKKAALSRQLDHNEADSPSLQLSPAPSVRQTVRANNTPQSIRLNGRTYRRQPSVPRQVQIDGTTYYLDEEETGFSKGISRGDWLVSLYGGAGAYIAGEVPVYGEKLEAKGSFLWSAGLSGMYFVSEYFGLGVGIEIDELPQTHEKVTGYISSSPYGIEYKNGKGQLSARKIMLLGRLNLNPHHSVRAYIPFGVGYSRIKGEIEADLRVSMNMGSHSISGNSSFTETESKNELAYFAGFGLEFNITQTVSLGLEARYNSFDFMDENFMYLNGLAKLNIKF